MRTARLPTIHASVATRCQYQLGSSSGQVWTGLQSWPTGVTSRGLGLPYLMSGVQGQGSHIWWPGGRAGESHVWCPGDGVEGMGALYSEVQCIMHGNGHMGTPSPCEQTDRHEWKHYLPTQLRWWAVIIHFLVKILYGYLNLPLHFQFIFHLYDYTQNMNIFVKNYFTCYKTALAGVHFLVFFFSDIQFERIFNRQLF